uniref:Uncharacterized protein n=1 Tax=Strigamia maritima TaxID=126957 RepID=T1JK40_STRMM
MNITLLIDRVTRHIVSIGSQIGYRLRNWPHRNPRIERMSPQHLYSSAAHSSDGVNRVCGAESAPNHWHAASKTRQPPCRVQGRRHRVFIKNQANVKSHIAAANPPTRSSGK